MPQQDTTAFAAFAKELKDSGLIDINKWPGYFMRKFNLTFSQAESLADSAARYAEVGKYERPKKVKKEYRHDNDDDE